jgi:hypothetical protein
MKLSLLPILSLLGSVISAPFGIRKHQHTERDGRLIQQAWKDIGEQYKLMDLAFQGIQTPTPGAFGQSNVPQIAIRVTPVISISEATALTVPAQTLSNTMTATLNRIVAAKPLVDSAGELPQVHNMLMEENNAYINWSSILNTSLPTFQKGMGQAFADRIIAAYQNAIARFAQ